MAATDKLSVADLLRQYLLGEITGSSLDNILEDYRYGGGKVAYTGVVTSIGDTVVITPTAGKSIQVFWVYTLTNPDAATTLITISIGSMAIYKSYGIAHWEPFTGAVGDSVVINLSVGSDVAVTIHYKEI